MRFKLGLLQDTATLEKQAAREAAEAQAKKHKHEAPTVKTEAQTIADEAAAAKAKKEGSEKPKEAPSKKPKIRPLSEAKAIDSGANFVSETFLLGVGIALILGENWRKGRQETSRREDVSDRIGELEEYEKSARKGMVLLEKEIVRLRAKAGEKPLTEGHILPPEVYELEEKEEGVGQDKEQGWFTWIRKMGRKEEEVEPVAAAILKAPELRGTSTAEKSSTTIFSRILPGNHTSDSEHKEQPAPGAKPKFDAVSPADSARRGPNPKA